MHPPAPQDALDRDAASHRSTGAFVRLGLAVVLVLCAVDVAGGFVVGTRQAANISGTLALAPALTGLSRSRWHTLVVGVVAVAAAGALAVLDGVPWGTGLVRTAVVLASTVLSTAVADAQGRQWEQLQDRRQAARTLQAAMLTRLPRPDHLQLVSRYLPASRGDQVGGDWYDALVDADGATVLVIGDVVGHDVRAAAAMGQVRGLLRAYAVEGGQPPAQLLHRVDEAVERLGLDVMATAVVVRVEQGSDEDGTGRRRLRWSSAGHPPPLLLLADDDAGGRARVVRLDTSPDPLLGTGVPGLERRDHVAELPVAATLLLYTDGLVERRGEHLDVGLDRLSRAVADAAGAAGAAPASLDDWVDRVLPAVLGDQHADDVAVLALRAHREDRPRPRAAGPRHPRPGQPLLEA